MLLQVELDLLEVESGIVYNFKFSYNARSCPQHLVSPYSRHTRIYAAQYKDGYWLDLLDIDIEPYKPT